jgi:SH3-like domain-containing protein
MMPASHIVTTAYTASNPDPINGKAGESVMLTGKVDRWEDVPEWEWIECVDARGRNGWVPATWLVTQGTSVMLRRDYDARELTAQMGQIVTALEEESGWFWCETADGATGWLPKSALMPA